jgi:hypothetical protein
MSDGHARRAKPPRAGRARRSRRLWLYAALPVALAVPAAGYVLLSPTPEPLEALIRQMRFDPLQPPSRLRGPGAIYVVDGGYYRKVCDAAPELLDGRVRTSPIPIQSRTKLENARFRMAGEFIEGLNASLGGSRVTSIEYRLKDASISEIALSELRMIEDKLLSQEACDQTVYRLLQKGKQVCSGYAVLSATTHYKVNTGSKVETGSGSRVPVLDAVQRQIAIETKGEVKLAGSQELIGTDLQYGIQLSSLCITVNTTTEPSIRDEAGARNDRGASNAPASANMNAPAGSRERDGRT